MKTPVYNSGSENHVKELYSDFQSLQDLSVQVQAFDYR